MKEFIEVETAGGLKATINTGHIILIEPDATDFTVIYLSATVREGGSKKILIKQKYPEFMEWLTIQLR